MDRVIRTFALAAGAFGAGAVVVAQGVLDPMADTVERVIGGAFLLIVGTVGFRWAFQLIKAVREDNHELRAQLNEVRDRLGDMTQKYESERELRMSLEEAGLVDRRRHHLEDPPKGTPDGF